MATLVELRERDDFPWRASHEEGDHTVYVEERHGSKRLRRRWWTGEGYDYDALGIRLRDEAGEILPDRKDEALHACVVKARALRDGEEDDLDPLSANPTLARLFDHYDRLYRQSPTANRDGGPLSEAYREDRRLLMDRWLAFLPGGFLVGDLETTRHVERYARARSHGEIDGAGQPVAEGKRQPVRRGTVRKDLEGLYQILNWAVDPEQHYGRSGPLLRCHPLSWERVEKATPSKARKVRRPRVHPGRYQALRGVAEDATMRVAWGQGYQYLPSHLRNLLDLAWHTGHRISAILQLREDDYLDVYHGERAPHGFLRWRAEADEQGQERVIPLVSAEARAAVLRARDWEERPDTPWLFPSAVRPSEPTCWGTAHHWLREGEEKAGLETQDGTSWHGFRRAFVYRLRNAGVTVENVAELGGWDSVEMVQEVYGRPELQDLSDLVRTLDVSLGRAGDPAGPVSRLPGREEFRT